MIPLQVLLPILLVWTLKIVLYDYDKRFIHNYEKIAHPQMDGQIEALREVSEEYLRS